MIWKRINIDLFAIETLESSFTHLHGIGMRDTYANSILIFFFKAQNESYQMTSAVKTVENLFAWCGHERYPMMMEINPS